MRFLIASRSKFFSEAIKFVLVDHEAVTVSSKEDLEKAIRDGYFHGAFVDLACGLDKVEEIIRVLKNTYPDITVFVFSFDPPSKFREVALELGADEYINRPLDPDSVEKAVDILKKERNKR